jgi:hypothetical protein
VRLSSKGLRGHSESSLPLALLVTRRVVSTKTLGSRLLLLTRTKTCVEARRLSLATVRVKL